MTEQNKKSIKVKLPEALEEGKYANVVSVHFNNNEVVLDFGYIIQNAKEPMVKVVSRVNMSHKTTESFLNVLSNAVLDWKNNQKKQNKHE